MVSKLRLPHTDTITRTSVVLLERELLYDDDLGLIYYGDGVTLGGVPLGIGSAVWGGITGQLANQTDLQAALSAKFNTPSGLTTEYIRGDGSLATFPTTFSALWGSITGTLSSQTDLQTALNAKFDTPTGTTLQYIRGDGSLATFPTSLPIAWGAITGTLSAQTDLQTALNAKFNNPTGTTSQYVRGDGTLATFPTIPTTSKSFGSYFSSAPSNSTIPLFTATVATTINEIRGLRTTSGTCTISIQIDGVNVTGLSGLSVTSAEQNPTASGANTVAVGADVTLVISSVSSAVGLRFTMGATLALT